MGRRFEDSVELGRIKWFVLFRLLITVSCIAIILIYKAGGEAGLSELFGAYSLLVFSCFLNVAYLLLLRRPAVPQNLPLFILSGDLAITALLTYLSGAAFSWFVLLYFTSIVASSLMMTPWSSVVTAGVASGLSSAVTLWYFGRVHWGWPLPFVSPEWFHSISNMQVRQVYATIFAQFVVYHIVAALSGMLASSLSRVRIFSEEILENMGEGAIAVDSENRMAFLNSKARDVLGLPAYSQFRGARLDILFEDPRYSQLLHLLQSRSERYLEMDFQAPSGRSIPLAVTSSVLRDPSGRSRGVVAILIDLTLRKRVEEAERRAARQEAAGELAAGIAHEVRNPLASIRGAAQELKTSGPLDGTDCRLMELIIRESDRLNAIITDFLAFARAKPPRLLPCDLAEVLTSTIFALEKRDEARAHPVNLQLEENLICRGDDEQLRQVFLNLGVNALEASEGNSLPIRIHAARELSTPVSNGSRPGIKVEFIDRGSGVPPSLMSKVFDPFFTTKPGGTGLGLSIVQRIVQNHDGEVQITSNPEGGTIVSIWLPEFRTKGPNPQ